MGAWKGSVKCSRLILGVSSGEPSYGFDYKIIMIDHSLHVKCKFVGFVLNPDHMYDAGQNVQKCVVVSQTVRKTLRKMQFGWFLFRVEKINQCLVCC